jgi:uncharacterized UPF0160 family protein
MMGAHNVQRLITHDGTFHADEVLATVVLRTIFDEAELIRTRDPQILSTAGEESVLYDVGGAYDPDRNRFDHHQPGAPTRQDGSPYSAFGLVWARYGAEYLELIGVDADLIPGVQEGVDRSVVIGIDLLDNGALDPSSLGPAAGLTLPSLIGDLNPPYDAPEGAERVWFDVALRLAGDLLVSRVKGTESSLRARREVLDAIEAGGTSPILELPRGAPFRAAIREAGADHVLLVVHPRKTDWVVFTVSVEEGSYTRRLDLPGAWAGLEWSELAAQTGVPDAVFCHRARFMAVAGTRDGALRMAELALEPDPVPEPF